MKRLAQLAVLFAVVAAIFQMVPSRDSRERAHSRVRVRGHSSVSKEDREARPLVGRIRGIARARNRASVGEVLEALDHAGAYTRAAAALAAGRLGAQQAEDKLRRLANSRQPDGPAARVALARLSSEVKAGNVFARVGFFLTTLGISVDMINDLALTEGPTSLEGRALREIADLVADANQRGEDSSSMERQFRFNDDYGAMLKVHLSKLQQPERISYLVNNIRTLRPTGDRSYDAQALSEEPAAVPLINAALAEIHDEIRRAPSSNRNSNTAATHLILALAGMGDRRSLSILQRFVDEPGIMKFSGKPDDFTRDYARMAIRHISDGTRYCPAPNY